MAHLLTVVSFLIATSVFRTNLNIRQVIEGNATAEERKRVRREIHDGVAQTLMYLRLKTDTVYKQLEKGDMTRATAGMLEVRRAMEETYREIRESLEQLALDMSTTPLADMVKEYAAHFGERYSIETTVDIAEPVPRLSQLAEFQMMRVIQEALANVRKHSSASKVWVTLTARHAGLEAMVKDNGQGFEWSNGDYRSPATEAYSDGVCEGALEGNPLLASTAVILR